MSVRRPPLTIMGKEGVISGSAQPVDVAPDGDVVFLIGSEKARVRVYSLILKNASKVFSAMLGPQFSEGRTLLVANSQLPTEISLPEDDPEAMTVICRILHGRNETFTKRLKSTEILNVSIAADKWDCVVPLTWAIKDWLKCEGVKDGKELWNLTLASYWFQNEEAFETLTRALIFHHRGPYSVLDGQDGLDASIPMKIRLLLEESRSKLRMQLLQSFWDRMNSIAGNCKCGFNAKKCMAFNWSMRGILDPNKVREQTVWDIIQAAENLAPIQPQAKDLGCADRYSHSNADHDYGLAVRNDARKLKEAQRGIAIKDIYPKS
ncbi:hypothetical protein BDZ45DRAFT_739983 [Acephala macrosclerotiorum]|nr:hypothetical protein BDZ45DRAFT_739983 [Acephala macrosclerotiorum]